MTSKFPAPLRKAWPLALLAAVVLVFGVCEWQGWPFLKGPAQRSLSERLQRPVDLGEHFRVKLLGSIRLDTDALRIGPPHDLPPNSPLGGDLVNARDAHLEVPYSTVLNLARSRGDEPLRITSLRLGGVDAVLKRQADGRANWTLSGPRAEGTQQKFDTPVVGELVLRQGHVIFDDALSKTFFDARLSTREGAGAKAGDGAAGLAIDGHGRYEGRPFEVHAASTGVLPLIASDHGTRVPITVRAHAGDSRFSFEGTGTDLLSFEAINGAATLSGLSLAQVGDSLGVTLPTTEPFKLNGQLSKSGQVWNLKDAELAVGDSRLNGNFSFDRTPKIPVLRGELSGPRLVLADLLPAFGAAGDGAPKRKAADGRMLPQREFDIPSLHRMNADVKVRLKRAELGDLFRQPLVPLQGDLSLNGGVLKLSNVLARAAGGEVSGLFALDANPRLPLWSADLRWAGIDLDQWLRPRNQKSQVAKPSGENPGYVTGKLGGHAQLHARGRSTAQMVGSTSGTVQLWVRDGTVSHLAVEAAGLDIAQGLGVLVVGDNPLVMNCALVKADAENGLLKPEVGIVDTKDSTLLISGSISLAKEQLDLTLTTRPKDVSPMSLRAPVHVQGTFAHPQVHLDKKPVERKLLGAAVLALVNPLAALIPLVDFGDKESAGGCQKTLQRLRQSDNAADAREIRKLGGGEKKS